MAMKHTLLLLALLGCLSAFGQSADWTRNTYSLWPRFASNIFNISLTNGVTVNGTNTTASEVFRVQNQGTNQFRVAPNSGYTGSGTNYLSDDGTFKALNYGTGTVTSVSLIVPGGLFVSGSPVTGSGTLRILTVLTNLVKGTGAGFSNALAGVDYQAPGSYITALTGDVTASGPGSASATLANSGVTNGVYGNSANIPQFSVDSKGRITGVTNVSVTAGTTINSSDGYIPYRSSGTAFADSPIYRVNANSISIGTATNIVYSDGTFLVYTNNTAGDVGIKIRDKNGTLSQLSTTTGGHTMLLSGTGGAVYLSANNNSGGDWIFDTLGFAPMSDGTRDAGATGSQLNNIYIKGAVKFNGGAIIDAYGTGSPEGVVTGSVGSTYRRTDGGAGTSFYVKESGTGNTGWVAK